VNGDPSPTLCLFITSRNYKNRDRKVTQKKIGGDSMVNKSIALEPRLMTAKELAGYLNFPLSTIYAMVEQKQIPLGVSAEK